MIGREVQPDGGVGAESSGPGQPEAAAFDDERLQVGVDRIDERHVGVPDGLCPETGGSEHGDGHVGRRRLAVGAGDGQDRAGSVRPILLPSVSEFDLGDQLDVVGLRGDHDVVGFRHTRRRHDEVELAGERAGVEGCLQQLDPERVRQISFGVVDAVVGDDDIVPATLQRANGGRSGDGEAVHEHSHGHPTTLVKSAMKIESAEATQIAEISQKRMMTVVSGQPPSSKW